MARRSATSPPPMPLPRRWPTARLRPQSIIGVFGAVASGEVVGGACGRSVGPHCRAARAAVCASSSDASPIAGGGLRTQPPPVTALAAAARARVGVGARRALMSSWPGAAGARCCERRHAAPSRAAARPAAPIRALPARTRTRTRRAAAGATARWRREGEGASSEALPSPEAMASESPPMRATPAAAPSRA